MAAAATMASVAVIGMNRHKPLKRRMSRVPLSWSMMPAAMNSDALNVAWFMMWKIAATWPRGVSSPISKRDQPEMADGRVGEQPFEVLLEDGEECAQDEGDEAGRSYKPQPLIGSAHRRPQPHQKKNAGLHHGRGVQIGRHRRRRRHRVRQPEMKRELRALCESAEQNEDQRRNVERMRADRLAGREHPVEVVAADDVAEDQHAGEQAEAARRRDDQGHPRAVARLRGLMPVADQEEGEEAGQLPEEDQLDQVARQHDAEHRAHERKQEREEARHRIGRRHVVARVEHHQEADAGDQAWRAPRQSRPSSG